MARIYKWFIMIYGSLQAEFMETKHNGHIHRYRTPIFGNIVVNVSKPINNNNQILWRLQNIVQFHMPNVLVTSETRLFNFCYIIFCMEEV